MPLGSSTAAIVSDASRPAAFFDPVRASVAENSRPAGEKHLLLNYSLAPYTVEIRVLLSVRLLNGCNEGPCIDLPHLKMHRRI
jgi:hypothetical protein